MREIVLPKPRFKFGQYVLIEVEHTEHEYERCPDCFEGKIKGPGKAFSCPTCHGSGRSYKILSTKKSKSLDGMLRITGVRVEMNEKPRDPSWGFEGVMYQGEVVWRADIEKPDWNIFRETCLVPID